MLTWLRLDQREVLHSFRTAVAAVGSLLIARFCRLPESYWAAVTTLVIMQSTLGAAWTVSKQRFVGTALGAAMGALLTAYADRRLGRSTHYLPPRDTRWGAQLGLRAEAIRPTSTTGEN